MVCRVIKIIKVKQKKKKKKQEKGRKEKLNFIYFIFYFCYFFGRGKLQVINLYISFKKNHHTANRSEKRTHPWHWKSHSWLSIRTPPFFFPPFIHSFFLSFYILPNLQLHAKGKKIWAFFSWSIKVALHLFAYLLSQMRVENFVARSEAQVQFF